ncbi:MAG: InlB B-repeat-containing protein [Spirochaetaceae bacterium]|nr:InlB B-repeat-containing protein [Spirochaetaceae bacterium]
MPGAGGLAYSGKTFTGWNTAANGSGAGYAAEAGFTVNGNTAFYAQWANEPVTPPGATLAEKFAYIAGRADDGAVYDIEVSDTVYIYECGYGFHSGTECNRNNTERKPQ